MKSPEEGKIYYDSLISPIGEIWIAGSKRGLIRIEFLISEDRFLSKLRRITIFNPIRDGSRFAEIRRMLEEYFRGDRVSFDISVDLRGTGFQKEVWWAISRIPYGRLSSYVRIAKEIGRPKAVRAVGNAVGANPLPIVIPCHRIIRADGGLGGYRGGRELKLYLLSLEGIAETGYKWSKRKAKTLLENMR